MLKGVHFTLLIGPGVPAPAPAAVLDALTQVQVTSSREQSGFQLTFTTGTRSPLVTRLIPEGFFDPMTTRVILLVTLGGAPQVLIDGIVTRQEVTPGNTPGQSTFTLTGDDLSVLMDVVEMPFMRYPSQSANLRVLTILAKYAMLGVVPAVIPPVVLDTPSTGELPSQSGTDLQYVRQLARENGYVFYLEPGPAPGMSLAYWGPDIRIPEPQPALNINLDAHTNVDSLSFSLDGLQKKVSVLNVMDPQTHKIPIPIPVPNLSILRPPLGARIAAPSKVEFPAGLTSLRPTAAAARALGISFAAVDSVTATGSLDVSRYGRVLRSRRLVGVRGAGVAYDGLYYVNSVTHTLKPGEYKQSFQLSRDGLVSLTPTVPV